MKNKHIHHSIDKKLDDLEGSLGRATGKFEGEEIHAFRVKIKKFRAFLTLLAAEDPQHSRLTKSGRAQLPRLLRRFYRMTGEIRNRQLQLERIKEYWKDREDDLPRTYTRRLKKELAAMVTRAGNYAAKKAPVKAAKEHLRAATPAHLHRRAIKRFLRKKTGTLDELLKTPQPWEDSLFHSIRKTLKDLQYMLPDLPPGIFPKISLQEKKISSLTDALGTFQDSCTILGLLDDKYLDPIPKGPERMVLEEWKKYWEGEKGHCKQGIYVQLQDAGLLSPGLHQRIAADPTARENRHGNPKAAE